MMAPGLAAALARGFVPPADRLWLDDGRSVVLQPVGPQDADAEQGFVRALSPASRVLRFHFGMRELAPELLRAMTDYDPRQQVAIAARDGRSGRLVADARFVLDPDVADEAEFAIAVADAWQGAGLGRALLQRLLGEARRRRIGALFGDVLRDNRRMVDMVRAQGGHFVRHPGDATLMRARFEL
jgi:GNAT superfamily N-acetyltransferase